ncbi:hypothetical protein [Verminephrobacter aporrectodeae]|uniref:hypothetical protein n=1 Tax=Verminephrobacter aporrectodeae TaxID=1110389 RepID=UPI002244CF97|nr:hypothetical protein [Verminephrobacter aporrectodeae]
MKAFRVTHVDRNHRRRRLVVLGGNRQQAVAWVEQLYGDAWYVSAIHLAVVLSQWPT